MSLRRELTAPDGHRISYLVAGTGPTLVLIPALLQSAEHWESVGYIERFAARNRVIAIDLLGHGKSDGPTDREAYGPEAVVEHVVAVLDRERVRSACIWGYSDGGEIALLIARRRPDSIVGVVIGAMFLGDVIAGLRSLGKDLHHMVEVAASALEGGDWTRYFDVFLEEISPDLRKTYQAANNPQVVAALTRAVLLRPRGFLKPPAPTFVYWFEEELFSGLNSRLAETMPIEWAVVPGSSNEGFLEVDEVAHLVEEFLDTLVRS